MFTQPFVAPGDTSPPAGFATLFASHKVLLKCAMVLDSQTGNLLESNRMEPEHFCDVLDSWMMKCGDLTTFAADQKSQLSLKAFSDQFAEVIIVKLEESAAQLAMDVGQQVLAAMQPTGESEKDAQCWDTSKCDRLLRFSTVKGLKDGARFRELAHSSKILLSLIKILSQFLATSTQMAIAMKPNEATATALTSFALMQRYNKELDFGGIDRLLEILKVDVKALDPKMSQPLMSLSGSLTAWASDIADAWLTIPAYDHNDQEVVGYFMQVMDGQVNQISDCSVKLKKRIDAAKHCTKLADCEWPGLAHAEECLGNCYSAVSTYSIAKLLKLPCWEKATATMIHKNRVLSETYSSLKDAMTFVESNSVMIPHELRVDASNKLALGTGKVNAGKAGAEVEKIGDQGPQNKVTEVKDEEGEKMKAEAEAEIAGFADAKS